MSKKPRFRIKSIADAARQLRDLRAECDIHCRKFLAEEDACADERRRRIAADAAAKAVRAEHDDLKKKLYDSEIELARLRGFLERVREDDAVRDPLVEIEDQMGKRQVTKRFPSNAGRDYYGGGAIGGCEPNYGGMNREKPKHWITY